MSTRTPIRSLSIIARIRLSEKFMLPPVTMGCVQLTIPAKLPGFPLLEGRRELWKSLTAVSKKNA